jgi:hypothetical protein
MRLILYPICLLDTLYWNEARRPVTGRFLFVIWREV